LAKPRSVRMPIALPTSAKAVVSPRSFPSDTETRSASCNPVLIWRRRTPLIWQLIYVSSQLVAAVQKTFLTRGTIGYATISKREGLSQHTIQSACMVLVRANPI
jgi:hypothetical protein